MAKMQCDPLRRVDTTKLYPPFLQAIRLALQDEADAGRFYVATSGYRSFDEQTAEYAKGRAVPGMKVTNAPAGTSYHNYGLALDFARNLGGDAIGLKPSWSDADLTPLAAAVVKRGLQAGINFKTIHDSPHAQYALHEGYTLPRLKVAYQAGGLKAVWSLLDQANVAS